MKNEGSELFKHAHQLTVEEAKGMTDRETWRGMTQRQRALFQFGQSCLSMPFTVFHSAVENTIGRPVLLHEFVLNPLGLIWEMNARLEELG